MRIHLLLFMACLLSQCKSAKEEIPSIAAGPDEAEILERSKDHPMSRMHYKLVKSKVDDRSQLWSDIKSQLGDFDKKDYDRLHPYIFNKDIPTIQKHVAEGKLTYELLTKWYLYRIYTFEKDPTRNLQTVIAINPHAVKTAKAMDKKSGNSSTAIYGMPILLKDNIGTDGMMTTAGAVVLKDNAAPDATIVKNLKKNGAIILGKVNLSEWAYYFCDGCPLGYSAIGGQTLNPYGRGVFESGGSSAGSGTSMAANYAAAAVGTETSGSILNPSHNNSLFGLKPTIGVLSRTGIVPIAGSLDTPGPMARTAFDAAILLSAMSGDEDPSDALTQGKSKPYTYEDELNAIDFKSLRLGYFPYLAQDSIYASHIEKMKDLGATVIEVKEMKSENEDYLSFLAFLNYEMKRDLPRYLSSQASENISVSTVKDIVDFNNQDSTIHRPYGQARLDGIVNEKITDEEFIKMAELFEKEAHQYLGGPISKHNLDAIISTNRIASNAAMARYPAICVPMDYAEDGQPLGLVFVGGPFGEHKLLQMAAAYERVFPARKVPVGYE